MAIPKRATLRHPLDASQVVQLERQLSTLHAEAVRVRTFAYDGNGIDGRVIPLDTTPVFVLIQKRRVRPEDPLPTGEAAFAVRGMNGVSYVPGGFVATAVDFVPEGLRLGAHDSVNAAGSAYLGLAIG